MVCSLNSSVDLVMPATSFGGLNDYGKIMIGNFAFEFFNDRNVNKYIQIPWEQVDVVIASVLFHGKWIPRFAIKTKKNGTYTFSARKSKKLLKAISVYIPKNRMVHSLSFFDVIKRAFARKKSSE